MSKYSPLESYLRTVPRSKHEVSLTFRQIEDILGCSLPRSARTYQAWWANQADTTRRSNSQAWQDAGFLVDQFTLGNHGSVCFRRK